MKYSKKDVKYTEGHGDSNEWCDKCRFYLKILSGQCRVVKGPINPGGWCMKYLIKIGLSASPTTYEASTNQPAQPGRGQTKMRGSNV